MKNREDNKFTNKDASALMKGVRTALSDADMDVITDLAMEALEKTPSSLEGNAVWQFKTRSPNVLNRDLFSPRHW